MNQQTQTSDGLECSYKTEAATKSRPATDLSSADYVASLSTWRHGQPKPNGTIHDFCVVLARLDCHPGWLSLWKGWTKPQPMITGVLLKKRIQNCA